MKLQARAYLTSAGLIACALALFAIVFSGGLNGLPTWVVCIVSPLASIDAVLLILVATIVGRIGGENR